MDGANGLLAAMGRGVPLDSREAFSISRGDVLFERGARPAHAYFPINGAVIALQVCVADHRPAPIAFVGREGCVGAIYGDDVTTFVRAEVREPGMCLPVPLANLLNRRSPVLVGEVMGRYIGCLLAQMMQGIACARLHSVEQRAARLVLELVDRTRSSRLNWRQDELASTLGAGRTITNRLLAEWRHHRLVDIGRGYLDVQDAAALARVACNCHLTIRRRFEELLPGP